MVSPELLRRYPFFAGLSHEYLVKLAKAAKDTAVESSHIFFSEGDELAAFYLILDGAVNIHVAVPDKGVDQKVSGQLTGDLTTAGITVSTVGSGGVFGWSALIPPTLAWAGATAVTPCRVLSFNCKVLFPQFENDYYFGYLLIQKAAQIIRERLRDMRIESLSLRMA